MYIYILLFLGASLFELVQPVSIGNSSTRSSVKSTRKRMASQSSYSEHTITKISGFVIATSRDILWLAKRNKSSAIMNRVLYFSEGIKEVSAKGMPVHIAPVEDTKQMKTLAKTNSHLIYFDWFDKLIGKCCNEAIYSSLKMFKHFSFHTIESDEKISPYDFEDFTATCKRYASGDEDVNGYFSKALRVVPSTLSGLRAHVGTINKLISNNDSNILKVHYVPVPIPTKALWKPWLKESDRVSNFYMTE